MENEGNDNVPKGKLKNNDENKEEVENEENYQGIEVEEDYEEEDDEDFLKPMTPSPELAEIVGSEPLRRTQVIKKLWVYIKKHELQDPENNEIIIADDKLRTLFNGKNKVTMDELAGIIGENLG